MVALPAAELVTAPVARVIVTAALLLLVQVPPVGVALKVNKLPAQIGLGIVITGAT